MEVVPLVLVVSEVILTLYVWQTPSQQRRVKYLSFAGAEECGTVAVRASPFITHGIETQPGQHPWHAALYHEKNSDLIYACGANLITKNHVLTVAHCATRQSTGAALNPKYLVVILGKYYLEQNLNQGIQERRVSNRIF